jgi:hypothetical protein
LKFNTIKKDKAGISTLLLLIIIVVVLAAGVGAYLVLSGGEDDNNNKEFKVGTKLYYNYYEAGEYYGYYEFELTKIEGDNYIVKRSMYDEDDEFVSSSTMTSPKSSPGGMLGISTSAVHKGSSQISTDGYGPKTCERWDIPVTLNGKSYTMEVYVNKADGLTYALQVNTGSDYGLIQTMLCDYYLPK